MSVVVGAPAAPIALVVLLAAALEYLVAEPPERFHPVAWLGRIVAPFDREWERPWLVGAVAVLALPLGFAASAWIAVAAAPIAAGRFDLLSAHVAGILSVVVAGLVLFSTTSYRMLLAEAEGVIVASGSDPAAARDRLPALAGRSPSSLSPGELRSAAVESVAENLADGLVAPLLAFVLLAPLSLALGAAGAAWVKGVNTMDSMLGYRSKPAGTPAARLDDVVMWVPARASAVLIAAAAASPDPLRTGRRWAGAPASPNAGWPMGTIAAALGVRLHKPGAYELNPIADLPDVETARRGVRIVGRAGLVAYGTAALVGVIEAWL